MGKVQQSDERQVLLAYHARWELREVEFAQHGDVDERWQYTHVEKYDVVDDEYLS